MGIEGIFMFVKKVLIVLIIYLCLISCCAAQNSFNETGFYKLKVSENGRFLEYENGKPFFWLGDTGWLLLKKLKREEAEKYLNDRYEKGFNVIQAMVIHSFPNINVYGDSAFVNNDPVTPKTTA